jgi:hypothetical protein
MFDDDALSRAGMIATAELKYGRLIMRDRHLIGRFDAPPKLICGEMYMSSIRGAC